jgi:hypothetical protein
MAPPVRLSYKCHTDFGEAIVDGLGHVAGVGAALYKSVSDEIAQRR